MTISNFLPRDIYQTTMNRGEPLYDEVIVYSHTPAWETSAFAKLRDLLQPLAEPEAELERCERRDRFVREIAPSEDASFEEQFDTVWPPEVNFQDALVRLEMVQAYYFTTRVRMAMELVYLRGVVETRDSILAAAVELVGARYVRTHPESAVAIVERLRALKREVLAVSPTSERAQTRRPLLTYLAHWEAALTPEQVALYV